MVFKKTLSRIFLGEPGNLREFFEMVKEKGEEVICSLDCYNYFDHLGITCIDEDVIDMHYKTHSGLTYRDDKKPKGKSSDFDKKSFLIKRMEEYSKQFPEVALSYVA